MVGAIAMAGLRGLRYLVACIWMWSNCVFAPCFFFEAMFRQFCHVLSGFKFQIHRLRRDPSSRATLSQSLGFQLPSSCFLHLFCFTMHPKHWQLNVYTLENGSHIIPCHITSHNVIRYAYICMHIHNMNTLIFRASNICTSFFTFFWLA